MQWRAIVLACMTLAALIGCQDPATHGQAPSSIAVPTGTDPGLDLYRAVLAERRARAIIQPDPASNRARQEMVWGLVGSILSVPDMGPPPSALIEQALNGHNLDVLDRVPGNHEPMDLVLAFINADLVASDPHSRYLPPVAVDNLDRRLSLFDEGLGIMVVEDSPGTILVSGVSEQSPASKIATLQEGAILKRMQDDSGQWYSPLGEQQWRAALSGPAGSWAGLEWQDTAGKTHTARLERTWWSIEAQRTHARVVDSPAGRLGVVSMPAFYDRGNGVGTLPDLEKALETLSRERADIMVLDLRGNRGGEWRTVMDAASLAMPGARLANAIGPLDRPLPVDVQAHPLAWKGPVWVWVDQHTASGGEILAGALRENVDACIVGERTFGKATMQERIDIKPPFGGQLLVTTVLYAWPSGNTAQWTGVQPDMWMTSPSNHDQSGERGYPSSMVPFSRDLSTDGLVYSGSVEDEKSWIAASIETPQCHRQ